MCVWVLGGVRWGVRGDCNANKVPVPYPLFAITPFAQAHSGWWGRNWLQTTGAQVSYKIWATSQENLSLGVSDQVWLKLACSASVASFFRVFEISDIASTGNILSKKWKTKMLIRLYGCAGWSASLLFAYSIKQVFSWRGLYKRGYNGHTKPRISWILSYFYIITLVCVLGIFSNFKAITFCHLAINILCHSQTF